MTAKLRFAKTQMLVDLIAPGLTVVGPITQDGEGFTIEVQSEDGTLGSGDEVVSVITRDTEQRHKFTWERR
jgi:hypothetical protein